MQTVQTLLENGGGESPAIGAPGRPYLDYAGLRKHVGQTVTTLNQMGLGRGDRVGIVLPNGPEMASAFVAIAAGTTTALMPMEPVTIGTLIQAMPPNTKEVITTERRLAKTRDHQTML